MHLRSAWSGHTNFHRVAILLACLRLRKSHSADGRVPKNYKHIPSPNETTTYEKTTVGISS
jgi:hypothetical protein